MQMNYNLSAILFLFAPKGSWGSWGINFCIYWQTLQLGEAWQAILVHQWSIVIAHYNLKKIQILSMWNQLKQLFKEMKLDEMNSVALHFSACSTQPSL